jgi:hypothetical protein
MLLLLEPEDGSVTSSGIAVVGRPDSASSFAASWQDFATSFAAAARQIGLDWASLESSEVEAAF